MKPSIATRLLVSATVALVPTMVQAAFHQWRFTEFFSNADGSVQFVELFSPADFENVAAGAEIRSIATGNVFSFPGNLDSTATGNKRLLIATAGFGSLPGSVEPDYDTLPENFFDPTVDTIQLFSPLFGVFHTRTFSAAPTDGIDSLNYDPPLYSLNIRANSPTNFAGQTGSVDLTALSGDHNGDGIVDAADYVLWRKTLVGGADGYDDWRANFGAVVGTGSGAGHLHAVPEPPAILLALALAGLAGYGARLPRRASLLRQAAEARAYVLGCSSCSPSQWR